jgi:hypothetical protein
MPRCRRSHQENADKRRVDSKRQIETHGVTPSHDCEEMFALCGTLRKQDQVNVTAEMLRCSASENNDLDLARYAHEGNPDSGAVLAPRSYSMNALMRSDRQRSEKTFARY